MNTYRQIHNIIELLLQKIYSFITYTYLPILNLSVIENNSHGAQCGLNIPSKTIIKMKEPHERLFHHDIDYILKLYKQLRRNYQLLVQLYNRTIAVVISIRQSLLHLDGSCDLDLATSHQGCPNERQIVPHSMYQRYY